MKEGIFSGVRVYKAEEKHKHLLRGMRECGIVRELQTVEVFWCVGLNNAYTIKVSVSTSFILHIRTLTREVTRYQSLLLSLSLM